MNDIYYDLARLFISYDPETGSLIWRKVGPEGFAHTKQPDRMSKQWNTTFSEKMAISFKDHRGYLQGTFRGRFVLAHRIAFLLSYGYEPDEVDHINGCKSDNRLANLRAVTRKQNAQNQKLHSRNTSGCSGVYWDGQRNKWVARLYSSQAALSLGRFDYFADAVAARKSAEAKAGYHPNHGRA